MNSCMMVFGLAGIALLIGAVLRAKVPLFRNMLVPASVIAGVLGLLFMNLVPMTGIKLGTDAGTFATMVNQLFTLSFISIGLTSVKSSEGSTAGHITKGAWVMGVLWCVLYTITPLMGVGYVFGDAFDFDPAYTALVQFGFAQGPGPAVSFGTQFENYGWDNAVMVGITFAADGFFAAFGLGIPMARYAIKHSLTQNSGTMDEATHRGYLRPEVQTERMVKDTTSTGNLETLSLHFVLVGLCYVIGVYEALRAATINAAYVYGEEKEKGRLASGKQADLVILSACPMDLDPMAIRDIQVLETIKQGRTLYKRA